MNYFVLSNPRSGTHLLLYILGSNYMTNMSHSHPNISILNKIKKYKPIIIYRDFKDVSISWWKALNETLVKGGGKYYKNDVKVCNLTDFIFEHKLYISKETMNPIDYWKNYIIEWRKYDKEMLVVRYENLLTNYDKQIKIIEDYLGEEVVCKSLPSINEVKMSRKGIIGDHKNYMDQELIDEINELCKDEILYIDSFLI